MITESRTVRTGTAAGVPYLAVAPTGDRATAPVVVAWHLLSPPCTPEAFAAAVPMDGLDDAWRIYLAMPMTGARLPAGGYDEIMRLGFEDAVRNLQYPIPRDAAAEFPAAWDALREELGIGDDVPVGLVGGSAGGAVAQLVLASGSVRVAAMVLINAVVDLKAATDATGRSFGFAYPWDDETLRMVGEIDFVARADELAAAGAAVRLVVGELDDAEGFREPAGRLHAALPGSDLVVVEGIAHELAEEPGTEPAPQLPGAARVDELTTDWLRTHLLG